MLDCNKVVTMVHHVATEAGDTYPCIVIHGCSWQATDGDNLGEGGEAPASSYAVHIPEERVPDILPAPGDFMALGAVRAVTGRKDLQGLQHFRVAKVIDNRKGVFLQHVKVVGA